MAQVKERGGGGEERNLPSPPPLPSFIFLALASFLARPKPKIPFLGLFLLRNQTKTWETFATQANNSPVLLIRNNLAIGVFPFVGCYRWQGLTWNEP